MEGTCNECVFPLNKEESEGVCPTDTSLIYAAGRGKLSCVKELIEAGADVNAICECHGNGVLHSSVIMGAADCLKELIKAGAEVDLQNKKDKTALMFAADFECLTTLISAGADVNIKDKEGGNTALMYAVSKGSTDLLKILISAGADANYGNESKTTPLMLAVEEGHSGCVKELIDAGADVNIQEKDDYTALMIAARRGYVKCLKELLDAGAEVDKQETNGFTALIFAVYNDHIDCVKELLKANAELDVTDGAGGTALMHASADGKVDILKELLAGGAELDKQDEDGNTALIGAVCNDHAECAKELIAAGADVNIKDSKGDTALIYASENGFIDCLKELLKADVNLNATDSQGDTSLIFASSEGHVNCVNELIAAGADLNICSEESVSPLVCAVRAENVECVKELLKAGMDVNITDGVDTALMVACEEGYENIVKILLEGGADVNAENSVGRTAIYMAITHGHAGYRREKSKKESKNLAHEVNFRFSAHTNMVFLLLKAGAHLNETSSGLKLSTAHLQLPYSEAPNIHILKMLSAAGEDVDNKDTKRAESINLKSFTRACIRKHLKQVHPETNLYHTVTKLSLPFIIQSYLLFDTLPKTYDDLNNDEREFLLNVSEGDIENATRFIEAGVDVNVRNENGMTALMVASDAGITELIKELLSAGADVNLQSSHGDSAIALATMKGQNDGVEELLKFGADTSIQGKDGLTALMHAAKSGDVKCLQMLIDGGADVNIPNDDDAANRIIRVGGRDFLGDSKGTTAIIYAARHSKVECIKKLIEAGADVNSDNERRGNTPLMAAIAMGKPECIRELVQAGADLNIPDKNGRTALMLTSGYSFDNSFPELMKAGAEVNPGFLADIARKLMEQNAGDAKELNPSINVVDDVRDSSDDEDSDGFTKPSIIKEETKEEIQELTEKNERMLRRFFKAGVTPDFAQNPQDTEALEAAFRYFGWKYPMRLSTLCKQAAKKEWQGSSGDCPMTIMRKGRRYLATVAKGGAISLQGEKSDVRLEIKEGCPKRAYLMEVRTDLSSFGSFILDDECFISPVVEVVAPAETSTSSYILQIPHCLDDNDDRSKVKVRMIYENRNPALVEVPKGSAAGTLFYDIDDRFIELHTMHFCKIICTICQTPYHCLDRVINFCFAKFETHQQKTHVTQKVTSFLKGLFQINDVTIQHQVEVRPYFCSVPHIIRDFREQLEDTVEMKCITHGSLKTSRSKFNPESGQIDFSLRVDDQGWEPQQGLTKWDPKSRIFTEKKELLDVVRLDNCHRCRAEPFEATIYSLEATDKTLEIFKGNFQAELTIDVEETSAQQSQEKQERMELPLNFSREDAVKPSTTAESGRECKSEAGPSPADHGLKRKAEEEHVKMRKQQRISETEIDAKLDAADLDELPSEIHDREIARLAPLFSPSTLETVALQRFGISEAKVNSLKAENIHNVEGFKRSLLIQFRNRPSHTRKDLFRLLLVADSEGIMDDVDLERVEKLILHKKK